MSSRILFIGRQPDQFASLWHHLARYDIEVAFAASQARALRSLEHGSFEIIVLDASSLRTPAGQLCQALRMKAPRARLILLSDSVELASLSYDFQLVMPTSWQRLLQTIQEAFQSEKRQVLSTGPFVLDLIEKTVVGPVGEARLTPKQFELLRLLMSHAEEPVERLTIMKEVWHTSFIDDTRTLDVHISWLRRAIEPEPRKPRYLVTKRGLGYVFYPNGRSEDSVSPMDADA